MLTVLFGYLTNSQFNHENSSADVVTAFNNSYICFNSMGSGNVWYLIEDAMPVSFRSELFTSYILAIFKQ